MQEESLLWDSLVSGRTVTASENWEALVAFFGEFPQYVKNDFYVTGESYGGIYVPTLVQTILDRQTQFHMNIKGFAIGNGCVSDNDGTDALVNFEYAHGMIDDNKWQKIKSQCCNNDTDGCPFHSFNGLDSCSLFVQVTTLSAWEGGINPYNMYDSCINVPGAEVSKRFRLEYKRRTGKELDVSQLSSVPCMNETAVTVYLNRPDVRRALGIPTTLGPWSICSDEISNTYKQQYGEMDTRVKNALAQGLKGMIYSGDVDMACNFLMGQRFSRKLGLQEIAAKKHYVVDGQIGGFYTHYDGLHFVTVRHQMTNLVQGAGHMVPTDRPSVAYHIINSFLFNQPF
ncbi:serine carboxypeptidase [Cooperia oncophora]